MKVVHVETLIASGPFATSDFWRAVRERVHDTIRRVDWPPGSGAFTIFPEKGKERKAGNGVKPIKDGMMLELSAAGWKLEEALAIAARRQPGKLDAVLYSPSGAIALEWETGNISSSHRALNKLALGLLTRKLVAGTLVVPSRVLYPFLTDRIGNWDEIEPYLLLWKSLPCEEGVLEIVVIEHDATSTEVPRIPKGTSGRAIE